MLDFIEILSVILVALATALAIAHALEMPGKMRLSQQDYLTVQHVYYPTFTIAGAIGEVGGLLATLILLFTWRFDTAPFWLTCIGVVSLLSMQVVYWAMTHPVQKYWFRGEELAPAAAGFFAFNPMERIEHETRPPMTQGDWTTVRERWEYSHLFRAALGLVALICVVTAVAI